jgi:hypothetical protein
MDVSETLLDGARPISLPGAPRAAGRAWHQRRQQRAMLPATATAAAAAAATTAPAPAPRPHGPATCVTTARRAIIASLQSSGRELERAQARLAVANAALRRDLDAKRLAVSAMASVARLHRGGPGVPGGGDDEGGGNGGGDDDGNEDDDADESAANGGMEYGGDTKDDGGGSSMGRGQGKRQQDPAAAAHYRTALHDWHRALQTALQSVAGATEAGVRNAAVAAPLTTTTPSTTTTTPTTTSTGTPPLPAQKAPAPPRASSPPSSIDVEAEARFRASVMGMFLQDNPNADADAAINAPGGPRRSRLPAIAALAGPAPAAAEAAAAVLAAEAKVEAAREAPGAMTMQWFGARLKTIVAFASLELDYERVQEADAREKERQQQQQQQQEAANKLAGAPDAGVLPPSPPCSARTAELAREWVVLIAAVSVAAPALIELAERFDLQRQQPVAGADAEDAAEDAVFEERSRRTLEAARLDPGQVQALSDALGFFLTETRAPLSDWRRAAGEMVGGSAGSSRNPPGLPPPPPSPDDDHAPHTLERLSSAVARSLVARSAFCVAVFSVVTPAQLLRAIVAVWPRALRPMHLAWAAHRKLLLSGGTA